MTPGLASDVPADSVRSGELVAMLARWREEAALARRSADRAHALGDREWTVAMIQRASVYEGCAAELEGRASLATDKVSDPATPQ